MLFIVIAIEGDLIVLNTFLWLCLQEAPAGLSGQNRTIVLGYQSECGPEVRDWKQKVETDRLGRHRWAYA